MWWSHQENEERWVSLTAGTAVNHPNSLSMLLILCESWNLTMVSKLSIQWHQVSVNAENKPRSCLVFASSLVLDYWNCSSSGLRSTKFCVFRWPAMGIHGDKSQQERDWVLNGEYLAVSEGMWSVCSVEKLMSCLCCRIQTWESTNPDCYRCCIQRSRLVQLVMPVAQSFLKKVYCFL